MSSLKTYKISYGARSFDLDGSEENFRAFVKEYAPSVGRTVDSLIFDYEDHSDNEKDSEEDREFFFQPIKNETVSGALTTVVCKNGRVKANELLSIIRYGVAKMIKTVNEIETVCPRNDPGTYYLSCAGQFAKFKSSIEESCAFEPGKYKFGKSSVAATLNAEERLELIDTETQEWIKNFLGLKVENWDFAYRSAKCVDIHDVVKSIEAKILSPTDYKGKDKDGKELFGPINSYDMGCLMKYLVFPVKCSIIGGPIETLLSNRPLVKFFDFLVALIFGVEGSRNNTVFYTAAVCLDFLRNSTGGANSNFTFHDFLSLFPLNAVATGSGNFVIEKALELSTRAGLENKRIFAKKATKMVGFGFFRHNVSWCRVTLKSAIVIYNDLVNNCLFDGSAEQTTLEFLTEFRDTCIVPCLECYLPADK